MSPKVRLFDVEDKERRKGTTTALVVLDPDLCPECGSAVDPVVFHEPALLRHGGYGATRRTTTLHCRAVRCRWSMQREIIETNPRSDV